MPGLPRLDALAPVWPVAFMLGVRSAVGEGAATRCDRRSDDLIVTALERLAAKIEKGYEAGLLPAEYHELALAAVSEQRGAWLGERAFRLRTGACDKWCRANFDRCAAVGLARRDAHGRREWHAHARLPKAGRDVESLKREIVDSFDRRTA